MAQIILTTQRLILRQWIDNDSAQFIKMNMDEDVMRFFPAIQTEDETLAHIERIKKHFAVYGYGLYAVERIDNGAFIGYTGFANPKFDSFFTPCVEIAWRLSKNNWGNGFATEAAIGCLKYGFEKLGFTEIVSFTAAVNKPSIRVMEKAGLKEAGIFEHPMVADGHSLKSHVLYKAGPTNIVV